MIAGHFGLAAAVKAQRRDIPLAPLMLATAWLDVVFIPLFAAGIERATQAPDAGGPGYASMIIEAVYTHSLVGALVLSAVLGLLFMPRYGRSAAIVIGAVAFSHWLIDLIMHRADMPIWPGGGGAQLGFGLWRNPTGSMLLELAFVLVGFGFYWAAARDANRKAGLSIRTANLIGGGALAAGVVVLLVDVFSPA